MSLLRKILGMKEKEAEQQREVVREEVKEQQKQKLQKLVDDVHKAAQVEDPAGPVTTRRVAGRGKHPHPFFNSKEEYEAHQQKIRDDHKKAQDRLFELD